MFQNKIVEVRLDSCVHKVHWYEFNWNFSLQIGDSIDLYKSYSRGPKW